MANSGVIKGQSDPGRRDEARKDAMECFVLHISDNFTAVRCFPQEVSKFASFAKDPIYAFPVINSTHSTDTTDSKRSKPPFSPSLEIEHISTLNLRELLSKLHENSPFRRGPGQMLQDSTLSSTNEAVHLNSVNTDGSQDIDVESYYGPEARTSFAQELVETSLSHSRVSRSDISQTAKELIQNIQKRFASQQEAELMLHSLTPASSLLSCTDEDEDSALPQPCGRIFDSQCSLMKLDEEITSDEEARGSIRASQSVEGGKMGLLVGEIDGEESHAFYKSTEALKKAKIAGIYKSTDEEFSGSSADEGVPSLPTLNFFSNGETASKNLLARSRPQVTMHQVQPKVLVSTTILTTINESFETSLVDVPDSLSPLYRKLVICEARDQRTGDVVAMWPCCGFVTSPGLIFSDIESMSKGTSGSNTGVSRYLSVPIVHKFLKQTVVWLSCGFEHCALVNSEGGVYTWGYGGSGCLGHGDTNSHAVPKRLVGLPAVVYMECGSYHNAAITQGGELFTWGRADVHQLGLPSKRLLKDDIGYAAYYPIRVDEFIKRGKTVKGVACGEAHTLVLDSEGRVYSFGWAEDGQLGLPQSLLKDGQHSTEISDIPSLRKQRVTKVAAGSLFSACLTEGGSVYVWGNGEHGQLGLGHGLKRTELPALQTQIGGEGVVDLVCGETWVLCLTQSGKAFGWGQGIAGVFQAKSFTSGMDLVCFVPRLLSTVGIAYHIVVDRRKEKARTQAVGFLQALNMKLKLLVEKEDSYSSEYA